MSAQRRLLSTELQGRSVQGVAVHRNRKGLHGPARQLDSIPLGRRRGDAFFAAAGLRGSR